MLFSTVALGLKLCDKFFVSIQYIKNGYTLCKETKRAILIKLFSAKHQITSAKWYIRRTLFF